MLHELCYPGLRVLLEGEPVTVRHVQTRHVQTPVIVEKDNGEMLAACAEELTPVIPGTGSDR